MTSALDRADRRGGTSRWLGVDLGGTNIKTTVVELSPGDGGQRRIDVLGRHQRPATAGRGPDAVMATLVAAARDAVATWGPVTGAGVGVPGLFDAELGTIEFFPNLPGAWRGTAVTVPVARALGVPVSLINDARAFTLAEARVGAGARCRTMAAYVLGTGIGGGIVVDGHLHFGPHGRAGELGHCVVEPGGPLCGCGNRGCLEAVASSGALARRAGQPTADAAFAAAAGGDARAQEAVDHLIESFGLAIADIVTILVPERIVIGGGVAGAGDALFVPLRASVARHVTLVDPDCYEIVPASLGPHSGAIGAAMWAADDQGLSQSG